MCECTAPELWAPIPSWVSYYRASCCGRVRSLDRVVTDSLGRTRRVRGRIMAQHPNLQGALTTHLRAEGRVVTRLVHHLVLEAFVGLRPPGYEGCHGDGDPTNNHLWNLRWDTASANMLDSVRHGTHTNASKIYCPLRHLLVLPNLQPSVLRKGRRGCLACAQTRSSWHQAGRTFDFTTAADDRYRRIMTGVAAVCPVDLGL